MGLALAGSVVAFWAAAPAAAQSPSGATSPEFYFRVSAHYQLNNSIDLFDNLPPGPGAWFTGGWKGSQSDEFGGGIAVGVRIAPALRFDISFDHTATSNVRWAYGTGSAGFDLSTSQVMVNGYLDLAPIFQRGTFGPLNPYLTAGVGQSWNKNGDYKCSPGICTQDLPYLNGATEKSLAWQVGAGLQWQIAPRIILDASWKYLDLGKTRGRDDFTPGLESWGLNGDLAAHRFALGIVVPLGGW